MVPWDKNSVVQYQSTECSDTVSGEKPGVFMMPIASVGTVRMIYWNCPRTAIVAGSGTSWRAWSSL